jgi:beta-N-acetylhexosaminidase
MTPLGCGATVFGCHGTVLGAQEASFFREADPFGFILFARNVENPDQLARLTADLRGAVGRDALITIDQEGGRVQRLRAPHWREWLPPMETVERAGRDAARAMHLQAQIIAAELRHVGIDSNCAPVADVATDKTHPFLKNRCYGTNPFEVAEIARAVAYGYLAGGVLPVIKHLPGHGRSVVDTHHDLPLVDASRVSLNAVDFAAFAALADMPLGMTAHLVFAAYDKDNPATQSSVMIEVIRQVIGFRGLLMTDDLNMQALSGSLYERTVKSMRAGVDLALHCSGDLAEMQSIAAAAGTLLPDAANRAALALSRRIPPKQVDIAGLEAEFCSILCKDHDGQCR